MPEARCAPARVISTGKQRPALAGPLWAAAARDMCWTRAFQACSRCTKTWVEGGTKGFFTRQLKSRRLACTCCVLHRREELPAKTRPLSMEPRALFLVRVLDKPPLVHSCPLPPAQNSLLSPRDRFCACELWCALYVPGLTVSAPLAISPVSLTCLCPLSPRIPPPGPFQESSPSPGLRLSERLK